MVRVLIIISMGWAGPDPKIDFCCYGGRVTQKDNLIDLSINVLFNLISASVAEDELNRD